MRHPRLTLASAGYPPLVAVAHGSKDPRAAATVSELLGVVAARAADTGGGVDVRAAFLDHCAPSLPQVLGALGDDDGGRDGHAAPLDGGRPRPPRAKARAAVGGLRSDGAQRRSDEGADSGLERAVGRGPVRSGQTQCIVVPLLLTAAYHSKSDIPAQLAAATSGAGGSAVALDVRCADTLGPHPLLLAALERRLREAGVATGSADDRARTAVVLAAAGSSDPAANATIADLAAGWQRDRGWRAVVPAYASAAGPSPAEAVAALDPARGPVVVATYLLAPGYFADKIRAASAAAGASAVSGVLGAAPEVADVVLARYRAAALAAGGADARLCERLWPDSGYSDRAVATRRLVRCSMRGNRRGTDVKARAPRRA
jgi:sirohydrochlorin ferrochelatase